MRSDQRRNANHQGSIWWNEQRQRYVGQISAGYDAKGRRIRRTVSAKTQAELAARLDELRTAVAVSPKLDTATTVASFIGYWLEDVIPLEGLAPNSIAAYENFCWNHIVPAIGRLGLGEVTVPHLRRLLAQMERDGLSRATQRLCRATLSKIFQTALVDGLIASNPVRLLPGIKQNAQGKQTMSPDEARAFLAAADAAGDGPLMTVLVGTGLRKGEALGLRWSDIRLDAARPALIVNGSLVKNRRNGTTGWQSSVKTKESRRTVMLPAVVVDALVRQRQVQQLERDVHGPDWGGGDLVFTTSTGAARDLDMLTGQVTAIAAAAGLGHWTPHGLRHTAASLLIAAGIPLKTISDMLGHASIRHTADVYGHLLEPQRVEAAEAMDRALGA